MNNLRNRSGATTGRATALFLCHICLHRRFVIGDGFTLYSTEPPERVKEQLGGTCLWVKDVDGMDVQLNLREIPVIGVMPCE